MAESTTVIAALKFQGGVIIAADSQATDPTAAVRWQIEKLERVGQHPLVIGFSGSVGMGQRARTATNVLTLHANMFRKPERIQSALDRALQPVYLEIQENNRPPAPNPIWEISLWGLAAFFAGGEPQILEREINGDSSFHDCFHAIGSGSQTAYAVFRTLGGSRLMELDEAKALAALLRILRTSVSVEMWGVSEPFSVWSITSRGARGLSEDELQTHLQLIDAWEEEDRRRFFESEI